MGGSVKVVQFKELDSVVRPLRCEASKHMDEVEAEEQPKPYSVSDVPYSSAFVKDGKVVDTSPSLATKVARVVGSVKVGEPVAPASLVTVQELAKEAESSEGQIQAQNGLDDALKRRLQKLIDSNRVMLFMKGTPEEPKYHKHAQKVLNGLGLGYEKTHACKNNCMLFYKEYETLDTCPICNESRFKMTSQNRTTKIPQKVMRYLPLKPRLQRLYMSTHTATDMRWHKEKRVDDDVMRASADGEAWKEFDRTFPDFAADPRNVRLRLATDGFNPYGVLNQHHSTWPIFVFSYNLPPWKCMKKEYMMLTVLITEDPGRSIDVYLRPLVDELKDLWERCAHTSRARQRDTIKARLDLERMGIRRGLWMNRDGDKARRDLAFFSMKPNDKKEFLKFVLSVKFPDGYASNIARCVNVDGGKFTGLKSHDCHVFMQRLLPVGIRHLLPEDVVKPIMLLSRFFSQLTAKTLRKTDMHQLRHDIVQVLCKFEMIFPPAFFTSTIHVMVHLPEEALLAGPVNYRWMYPIERLLGELKKTVRNRAKPEGSIIEAWVQYESLTFCGMYLQDVDTAFNRPQRNNDGGVRNEKLSVFAQRARPFGDPVRGESFSINDMQVNKLKSSNSPTYSEELYNLAFGPIRAELFSGCHVNGIKFLGAAREDKLCTQNSGVHVPGGGESTDIDFYGKLTTVVQLLYKDRYQVIMFKCRWFDTNPNRQGSVKIDHGLISVNINRTWYDDDPFILANMAKQIVYLDDPKAGSGWKVVQHMDQRNVYAIPELDPTDNDVTDHDVTDQRLESSMENDAETLRDTNVIQEPFQVQGVSSIEIPIQSITIDLGDLPRYDVSVGPNYESDEEEDWETESDDSDDNEGYYSSDDE
ncbi:unnamed protein product [Prunus armeniaca]